VKSPVSKRSIVIARHKTSVSLEDEFWNSLKEIAGERGMTLAELVAAIDRNRQHANLSSAIRFLSLASIAISIAKTEREERRSPKDARPSERSSYHQQGGAKFKSLADAWVDLSGSPQGSGANWRHRRKRKWVHPLLTAST
jgi:predicted DNA-binding ribbon-helix-helix protein